MEQSIFQFTTSHGGRHGKIAEGPWMTAFNSRPHTEVDCTNHIIPSRRSAFNSRPHTEVDGVRDLSPDPLSGFQFTTSHGGRPSTRPIRDGLDNFQFTTSHGGRQEQTLKAPITSDLSIHDLTRRSTIILNIFLFSVDLSIHDLTRRSTFHGVSDKR